MNRGFIPLGIVIAVVATFVVTMGGGVGVYKYHQVVKEKERIEDELKTERETSELATESVESSDSQPSSTDNSNESADTDATTYKQSSVELSSTPTPTVKTQTQTEIAVNSAPTAPIIPAPEKVIQPEVSELPMVTIDPTFEVLNVRQTFFEDEVNDYGSFEIELAVTAGSSDVLIPKSTSDTANTGGVGFYYSVLGGFVGIQDSEVSCSLMTGDYCKIKAGMTSNIRATVWLFPDDPGNYGVKFDEVTYFIGNSPTKRLTYDLDTKTGVIFVY